MSAIIVIIDGMEDITYPELDGKDPFGFANCKNIMTAESTGLTGMINTVPDGYPPDSLYCIGNILGVHREPRGRAFFEAIAIGIQPCDDDLYMRCNIVGIENGIVTSSCGGKLSEEEMKARALSTASLLPENYEIHHMGTYKNMLVVKNGAKHIKDFKTFAPHMNIGRAFDDFLSSGTKFADDLSKYCVKTRNLLGDYAILPWGESLTTKMPSFEQVHGVKGAAVCKTEIVVGITRASGMHTPDIEGTTGDTDTDLSAKTAAAIELMRDFDFVLVHLNGSDEAGHRKNPVEKSNFVKQVDEVIVGGLLSAMSDHDSMFICSDHATVCQTAAHTDGPVRFWLIRKGENHGGKNVGTIKGCDCVSVCRTLGA